MKRHNDVIFSKIVWRLVSLMFSVKSTDQWDHLRVDETVIHV